VINCNLDRCQQKFFLLAKLVKILRRPDA
jgi:hypothetical protein